jgi:hypothetical protein
MTHGEFCLISDEPPDDHHWPIMEILTAYVREDASWKEEEQPSQEDTVPSETQPTQSNQSLPKLATDIQAILTVLGRRTRTYGKGEVQPLALGNTDLRGAWLLGAHLAGANLRAAYLEGADLAEAHMEGANLWQARLRVTKSLTVEQLSTAKTLCNAHLDPPLQEQIQQQYPHLLEEY